MSVVVLKRSPKLLEPAKIWDCGRAHCSAAVNTHTCVRVRVRVRVRVCVCVCVCVYDADDVLEGYIHVFKTKQPLSPSALEDFVFIDGAV